ncbi:non-homologous end-joining DNA ligase [Chondromyces crocatus]|uniref:ATP-dependent DNA ligase n=1 Tax=Chondromyces crocatus TaxID=52 RepID=A0A0K1E862_CHOCO|nr:non-homologous end-joining DNA ligase [Chondromyces crocatus]AKT36763.1 ATP-dependent DNA ligase [Chondromyces crocatus]
MKLDEYRRKRDPERTNEPFPTPEQERRARKKTTVQKRGTHEGSFVVHLHDARRRHYDLRIEVGGVLASFAVPRGPSLDPKERRLAVRTEDHPLDYIDFEKVIPEGNYGAGPMILWDRGTVRYPNGSAEEGLGGGKLDLELAGTKLQGAFTLVRTGGRRGRGRAAKGTSDEDEKGARQWLLIKRSDEFAETDRDLTAEAPRSVLSGLTVEELEAGKAPPGSRSKPAARAGRSASASTKERAKTTRKPAKAEGEKPGRTAREAVRAAAKRHVPLSNPTKVLWPGEGISKRDLQAYYEAVGPLMLPYLRDRPVMLVRYPDGIEGKHFHQWSAPRGAPSWLRTARLETDQPSEAVDTILIDSVESLLYVANLAAIEVHTLAARVSELGTCDFLTIDFDVKQSSLRAAVPLALELRQELEAAGLQGFPKTSGKTGLHVLVPLGPGIPFETAKMLADLLGRLLVHHAPEAATMERFISRRGKRVFVDTGQTGQHRTLVAPYSPRAVPEGTVSMPLDWEEVTPALDPRAFTLETVPGRLEEVGDRLDGLLSARPDVPDAVARLERMARRKRAA